ncbi:hypothetical protein ACIQCD_25665 [Streptomyces sp. NPDC093250]|uniref:hypothetical protein n=1 Tax=Streptomyces sp. NPDC093250 TaxID=3366036 RepID=UPI003802254C
MGTSLTPEFWRLFAVLLGISTAVTFALSAALDALVLRAQRRRIRRQPTRVRATEQPRRPDRIPVHR